MSVQVTNLTKIYSQQIAVNKINFQLQKGEITGFLGPNGAGKSTTMKMITGALTPTEGSISINGIDMLKQPIEAQKMIGYLPEHNPLYTEMYVREYLSFTADLYPKVPKSRVEEVIALTGLTPESNKKIEALSKGYRQRVGLASALIHDPEILILDEPTTGLDPNQLVEIRHIIKELGKTKTILLSSHIMQEIQAVADRVIVLHKGNIVLDKPMKALQGKEQIIEVAFDFRVEERLLRNLPHIVAATNVYDFLYQLQFSTSEDMRPAVFDFAKENGLKILQINHKHNDLEDLEKLLKKFATDQRTVLIATETVFSMDGDSPDLRHLVALAKKYGAYVAVDEAHAIGVFGTNGSGLIQALGLENDIFARIVTFGKGLGAHGAAVVASAEVVQYLVNFSRSFIYTTAMSPHSVATIRAGYEQLSQTEAISQLHSNISYFKTQIAQQQLQGFIASDSAIQAMVVRGNERVKALAAQLQAQGIGVLPILAPTVPAGEERLRICLHSFNTEEEIKKLVNLLTDKFAN